jgi:hypothetical protein
VTAATNVIVQARASERWLAVFAVAFFVAPVAIAGLIPAAIGWAPLAVVVALALGGFVVWPARTIVVFALFVLFVDTIRLWAGGSVKLADEIIVPAMGLITLIVRRRVVLSRLSLPREAAAVTLGLAAVISSLLNGVGPIVLMQGLDLLGKGLTMFYVALLLDVSRADIRWAAKVVLLAGVVILATGAVELVAPTVLAGLGLTPSVARAGLPAIKSLFYHPQLFGWFCAFVALYLFAHHAVLGRRWFLVLGLLFSIGTILSARRRSIVALGVGLAAGIVVDASRGREAMARRLRQWAPSTIGIVVLAIAFLPAFAALYELTIVVYVVPAVSGGPPVDTTGGGGVLPTEAEEAPARIALYIGSAEIARDHFPFGAGLGRYGSWISREQYSSLYHEYGLDMIHGLSRANPQFITDTFWPQVLGETGIVGAVAYVLFLGVVGIQLWQVARRRLPPDLAAVAIGTAMVFAQTLVESLASAIFNSPSQVYLVMIAIGGTMACALTVPSTSDRAGQERAPVQEGITSG